MSAGMAPLVTTCSCKIQWDTFYTRRCWCLTSHGNARMPCTTHAPTTWRKVCVLALAKLLQFGLQWIRSMLILVWLLECLCR